MKHANTLLQQAADLLHSCDEITAVEIHRKQTERAKAVRILHQLQRYRRGNIGFDVSDHLSLHAFGYYYSTSPIVGPALSPYVNTTNYGGYADIRFSDRAGSNIGIRRYLNPMSGRWTTEPIVTPYFRIGKKMRLELPVGGLLKAAVWGDRDNPLRFQPRPRPTSQQKQ